MFDTIIHFKWCNVRDWDRCWMGLLPQYTSTHTNIVLKHCLHKPEFEHRTRPFQSCAKFQNDSTTEYAYRQAKFHETLVQDGFWISIPHPVYCNKYDDSIMPPAKTILPSQYHTTRCVDVCRVLFHYKWTDYLQFIRISIGLSMNRNILTLCTSWL